MEEYPQKALHESRDRCIQRLWNWPVVMIRSSNLEWDKVGVGNVGASSVGNCGLWQLSGSTLNDHWVLYGERWKFHLIVEDMERWFKVLASSRLHSPYEVCVLHQHLRLPLFICKFIVTWQRLRWKIYLSGQPISNDFHSFPPVLFKPSNSHSNR